MSEYEKSLKDMYEMGVKHGYELAKKDQEIMKLKEQIQKLKLAELNKEEA